MKVKLSIPSYENHSSLSQFIGNDQNRLENIKFYVNDSSIQEADFWFIFEDLNVHKEFCNIDPNCIFYLNTETSFKFDYFLENNIRLYLDQFSRVYSPYTNFHKNNVFNPPFLTWMINGNHGNSYYRKHIRDINFFLNNKINTKNKELSVICSNKTKTEFQHLRYEFVKELKRYFTTRLDWYGNGVSEIDEKWYGISNYKYHISIENNIMNNVISEKIYDSYLGQAYPFYSGAQNLNEYFKADSFSRINIFDLDQSIEIIENDIANNKYENSIEELIQAKKIVCNELNPFYRILNIIKSYSEIKKPTENVIYNKKYFYDSFTPNKQKIKDGISRFFRI